jgi:hypothetical protein
MRFLLLIFTLLICNISYADIDLFEAQKANNISIQYIANNEKHGQLIIENKTDKPLSIKLPQSFGLIPVLAQVGFNNGGIQPFNNGRNAGFNNGGIQQNSFQQLGGGFGNNAFANIKPHGKSVIKTNTICLDYGLRTPNTRSKYTLVKLDEISNDSRLDYAIEKFSNNDITQQTAQVLGWHINSGLSWKDLYNTNLFTREEILLASTVIDQYNYIN